MNKKVMINLRETIIMTVVENSMIDVDNTGQERYTLNKEQFGLLIDDLVKKIKFLNKLQDLEKI